MLKCGFCERTSLHDNPCPKRHEGLHLVFVNASVCLPCRNYTQNCLKTKSATWIKEQLAKSDKNRLEYRQKVDQHSELFDNTPPGKQLRNVSDVIEPPSFVNVSDEMAFKKRKHFGVFWPRSVLERHKVPFEEKDLKVVPDEDEPGLVRDSLFGTPSGSTELFNDNVRRYVKTEVLADSQSALMSKEKVDEAWDDVKGKVGKVTVESKTKDGQEEPEVSLKRARAADDDNDDCSWDDILPGLLVASQPSEESPSGREGGGTPKATRKKKKPKGVAKRHLKGRSRRGGAPAPKASVANPKAKGSKAAPSSASKVFPSVQLRLIGSLEAMISEEHAMSAAAASEEGIETLQLCKVEACWKKLESKVEADDTYDVLSAANTRRTDGNDEVEDLGSRGSGVWKNSLESVAKLRVIAEVLKSKECTDECALEYSPAFLLRAISDATSANVVVTPKLLEMVVRREALGLAKDGNINGAIATINPQVSSACGVKILSEHPRHQAKAQASIAVAVIDMCFNSDLSADLQHTLKSCLEVVKRDDFVRVLRGVLVLHAFSTGDFSAECDVDDACKLLAPSADDDELMRDLKNVFARGRGKTMLADAKKACLQQVIDKRCRAINPTS